MIRLFDLQGRHEYLIKPGSPAVDLLHLMSGQSTAIYGCRWELAMRPANCPTPLQCHGSWICGLPAHRFPPPTSWWGSSAIMAPTLLTRVTTPPWFRVQRLGSGWNTMMPVCHRGAASSSPWRLPVVPTYSIMRSRRGEAHHIGLFCS